ncbi:MAG: hypothetical protein ONB05_05145, partial [candidate division KSB1 bacterium]|nr:hypothetical protein [candidate division KSB1 bacterium]
PIRCSSLRDLKQATLMVSNTEYRQGKIDPFKGAVSALKMAGSTAYRIALVAKGEADLYLSVEDKNEWDICAADILIHEAGGLLTDLSGQQRRYNQTNPHIPEGIIAGNKFLIREILKLL